MTLSTVTDNTGWRATLDLGFAARPAKTVLLKRKQFGPLTVQKPFYPEGPVCHLYLLHPPGGVVGGDSLGINCYVGKDSSALITTPGAGKFYRSAGSQARQIQTLTVEKNASLEWLPQENIFFPGANCRIETQVNLQNNSRFIGWEIHCLGRPAIEETFSHGSMVSATTLIREGKPLLTERLRINGESDLGMLTGLRHYPVNASLFATGANAELLDRIQTKFTDVENAVIGHTLLEDVLVSRYIGHSTEQARLLFTAIWQSLRPDINHRPASCPRIWST